jgi:hypothetical protein
MAKTDNGRGAKRAKVELREHVLEAVQPARVFDAFCGLGEMWSSVWNKAASYVGCDSREWTADEKHKRFVADNRLVMRCVDLQAFNVFDFDAYGSPWDQLIILAKRRTWAEGEIGAVVITDGSSMKTRFGSVSTSMAAMLGVSRDGLPRSMKTAAEIQKLLIGKWCKVAGVRAQRIWRAEGKGSGRGGQTMTYTAIVFEGCKRGS